MKNYKQILEAINKGILLALDDFKDVEVLNVKSKQVYNRDYTKEYLDLMEEVVDLGLPSGTLWCKYNLGVDPNLLSKVKDWYGKYYAWGEIKPIKNSWKKYKYVSGACTRGSIVKMSKYCNNPKYGYNGFVDNITELLPEDDVAALNTHLYNFKFHIPTEELFEELIKYTTSKDTIGEINSNGVVKNYNNIEGLNGVELTSKINGNKIFFPAAGCRYDYNVSRSGTFVYYWTSTIFKSLPIYALNFYIDLAFDYPKIIGSERYIGMNIRPVINLK